MGDRLYEDLEIALPSFSRHSNVDYNDEVEEMEGDYEDEEVNGAENEEKLEDLACPICPEDFDVLGLCCHIDADHRMEVKLGICPVCTTKVGINMASHVISQHENILKTLCYKKQCSARSRAAISLLRKDLQEKYLSAVKEVPCADSSSDVAADSMLLSFVNNPQYAYRPQTNEATSFSEASISAESSIDESSERIHQSILTSWNNETASRREFVQGLVLSAIFDDI